MGTLLEGLLKLQAVERQLAQVRGRLRTRHNILQLQQQKVEQLKEQWQTLHDQALTRRKDADALELDLKEKEEHVSKLRAALNTAKTNKEYAGILTQLNSLKADNAKIEDQVLAIMQDAEAKNAQAETAQTEIEAEKVRLVEVEEFSAQEIQRLNAMMDELTAKRGQAAKHVTPEALASFGRIADKYDGEAMAVVEVRGIKPPYTYVCGGCFMGLNAEHANALRVRDEIRTCDNCQRILYLEPEQAN